MPSPRPAPLNDDEEDSARWDIPPFWQRLNSFFLFPLQLEPLLYAALLALACLALLLGGLFAPFVLLGLLLAVSRYAFKVAALASVGVTHSDDYRSDLVQDEWKWLPWKLFAVMVVHGLAIGWLAHVSLRLGVLGNVVSSLLLPATVMVLINTCSLRAAINPFELLGTITGIGKSYLLLCFFLFLLMQGMPMAAGLLAAIVPRAVVVPAIGFAVIYFTWVMAAMIGYVMYQHHRALDISPVRAPEGAAAQVQDPAAAEARRRDAQVLQWVQAGDMHEALTTAREWLRTGADDLADHRRYHRVLKVAERPDALATHAQQFIPVLLRQQLTGEALEVWTSCYKRAKGFQLAAPDATLALARHAWKAQQARHVLALLQGFEKQFPDDGRVPEALELIVRALQQGLNDSERAVRVFMRMKGRYPDHPCTQEAAWVLREQLGSTAAAT
jgi:hypothetical protein